jgi:TadE-like protein
MRIRRQRRGQALVETAVILPILLVLAIATFDLTNAYRADLTGAAAGRSGIREAIIQPTLPAPDAINIGNYIRGNFDKKTNWGLEGAAWPPGPPYKLYANCPDGTGPAGANCGEPHGCAKAFMVGQDACFAVGTCTPNVSYNGCSSATNWSKCVPGSGEIIVVRVASWFKPASPIDIAVLGSNLQLVHDQYGVDIYVP